VTDPHGGADRLRPYLHREPPTVGPLPVRPLHRGPFGNVVDGEFIEDDPVVDTPDVSRLRPYQLTGGRTAPVDPTLAIEAQVVAEAAALARPNALRFEHRDVVSAARAPVSVAELGALLRLHLQVVRVLVADLAAAGHLRVLRPQRSAAKDPAMIERVIRGLSAIS
jgi:Protein of unknown function (DUF742)